MDEKLNWGKLVILNQKGQMVFSQPSNQLVTNFCQWKINGHIRYSYLQWSPAAFQDLANLGSARHVVILDSAMNKINEIHLLPYQDIKVNKGEDLNQHDFILLSDDHYIALATYQKQVNNIPASVPHSPKAKIGASIIQEVNKGKVVWQWDATNFPELYITSEHRNNFLDTVNTLDYVHINSIFIDGRDSNLLVSFYNSSQIVKIDRHSGKILWRLGGKNSDFKLEPNQVFYFQHNVSLIDSGHTILMLDNSSLKFRPSSRILEFKLDEFNKKVLAFKSYNIPEPFASHRGSVQLVDDNYLICGGSAGYILEVNRKTSKKIMELKSNKGFYRAFFTTDVTGLKKDNF
jgi:hypothetical protein